MQFNCREDIIQLTPLWKGERLPDGRPYVTDDQLERIRKISLEEVWQIAWNKLYNNQYQEGFLYTDAESLPMVGRAVTVSSVPMREDLGLAMLKQAKKQGKAPHDSFHSWVIGNLAENDVVVIDCRDKAYEGPMIGGNLGASIKRSTKRGGAVVWGAIRDLDQLEALKGVNFFHRHVDPTPGRNEVMVSYNGPCMIGNAVCLPGDVVYACKSGVFFLPAHLVEETIVHAEKIRVRDLYGAEVIASGRFPTTWVDSYPWHQEMMDDFLAWFKTSPKAVPYQHLDWTPEQREIDTGHSDDHERYIFGVLNLSDDDPRIKD